MPRSFVFVLVLLSLSLGLNVRLAWQVKQLPPPPAPNKVGVQVGSFNVTDLQGHADKISFSTGKPTIIYYVHPECHWCKANSASFATLATAAKANMRVLILSQSTEKMAQFLGSAHLPNPVLILKSPEIIQSLGLTVTPQTFVISSRGRVEHHWLGAYVGQTRSDIERAFGLHLPKVSPQS